jgi:hypothetical protein
MGDSQSDIFVAKESFSATVDGESIVVRKGQTRVRGGHPLLEGREALFEPVDLSVHYDIEQATKAPGEKRGQRGSTTETPAAPEPPKGLDEAFDREVLDAAAAKLGVEDPDKLGTKAEVIGLIRAERKESALLALNRDVLDALAVDCGVDDPAGKPNKGEVVKAILDTPPA